MDKQINLTQARVKMLPIPERHWGERKTGEWAEMETRVIYHDSLIQGFGVRVSSGGTKTLILYKKINGRPQTISIGRFPGLTVEKARGIAIEMNGLIARGENPHDAKKAAREELTLGEIFKSYLDNHLKPNRATWKAEKARYDRHMKGWAGKRISAISRLDVRALHGRIGREHGRYAANRLLQLIRAVYNYGAQELDNPGAKIKLHHEAKRERFLQPHELPAFFQSLAVEQNGAIRDYVLLSLMTGARRGNVLAMRWEEIDFEAATWTIPGGKSKNLDPVTVPLHDEAIQNLKARRRGRGNSPWVFPGPGKSGYLTEPKFGWARICERAGLKNLRLHDLRRTLGSWQAARGASLTVIGKSLGHRSTGTTAIYARLNMEPVRESVEGAVNDLLAAGGVKEQASVVPIAKGMDQAKVQKPRHG